jgi:hypothetical protein
VTSCPAGATACGESCVDLTVDPDHCGACASRCTDGHACVAGACVCPSGTTDCGGRCVDLSSASSDCGACGHACGEGGVCAGGACTCPDGLLCGGACISNSDQNCGACGNACPSGQSCQTDWQSGGLGVACEPSFGMMSCQPGQTSCYSFDPSGMESASCVDTASDIHHCGGCGQDCVSGPPQNGGDWCWSSGNCYCVAGVCKSGCNAPLSLCGSTCTDVESDPSNCGFCGTKCGPGLACTGGQCGTCTASQSLCDGTCVDQKTDPKNCGGCGVACPKGASCTGGKCACPAGFQVACGTLPPACIDFSDDNANCGLCYASCSGGATCSGGQCACPSGKMLVGGACQ